MVFSGRPGSPCNRFASPDRLDSPHNRSALNSPDRSVSPTFRDRGRRGRGVQGRGRRGVFISRFLTIC